MMVKSSESRVVMPLNGLHLNAIRVKGSQKTIFIQNAVLEKLYSF